MLSNAGCTILNGKYVAKIDFISRTNKITVEMYQYFEEVININRRNGSI